MKEVVGKNIRFFRLKAKLTQQELAKLVDVVPSAVGNWEQAISIPSSGNLYKLCHIFKITSDELVFNKKRTTVRKWTKNLKNI